MFALADHHRCRSQRLDQSGIPSDGSLSRRCEVSACYRCSLDVRASACRGVGRRDRFRLARAAGLATKSTVVPFVSCRWRGEPFVTSFGAAYGVKTAKSAQSPASLASDMSVTCSRTVVDVFVDDPKASAIRGLRLGEGGSSQKYSPTDECPDDDAKGHSHEPARPAGSRRAQTAESVLVTQFGVRHVHGEVTLK